MHTVHHAVLLPLLLACIVASCMGKGGLRKRLAQSTEAAEEPSIPQTSGHRRSGLRQRLGQQNAEVVAETEKRIVTKGRAFLVLLGGS